MITGLFVLGLIGALAYYVEENGKLKSNQKGGQQ